MNRILPLTLTGLGVLLLLVGLLFEMMHWPDLFKGLYSGPILIAAGLIIWWIKKLKLKS